MLCPPACHIFIGITDFNASCLFNLQMHHTLASLANARESPNSSIVRKHPDYNQHFTLCLLKIKQFYRLFQPTEAFSGIFSLCKYEILMKLIWDQLVTSCTKHRLCAHFRND